MFSKLHHSYSLGGKYLLRARRKTIESCLRQGNYTNYRCQAASEHYFLNRLDAEKANIRTYRTRSDVGSAGQVIGMTGLQCSIYE